MVLDILDDRVTPKETAWILLGFREGWLFRQHGHNIMLDVGGGRRTEPLAEEADPQIKQFAFTLAQEALDAAKNST